MSVSAEPLVKWAVGLLKVDRISVSAPNVYNVALSAYIRLRPKVKYRFRSTFRAYIRAIAKCPKVSPMSITE